MFDIDASELVVFGDAMGNAGNTLQNELKETNRALLHQGVGYAMENAPVDNGDLKNSIRILEGPTAEGGSYGSTMVYAWMREEGGTIYPRHKKALAFMIGDKLIIAQKVTQKGTKYMERSADRLEPLVEPAYQLAVDRTLGTV